MPNCDWGRPCNCRECTDMHRREICDICNKEKTVITDSQYETDRKGMSYYNFINYCQNCWNEKKRREEIKRKKRQVEELRKEKERIKLKINLDKLEYSPIPIKFAVAKYRDQIKISNSDKWIRDDIIRVHKDTLKVNKTSNRWYCCNNRLKLMNFKLYY